MGSIPAGSYRGLEKQYLRPVQPRAQRQWKRFTVLSLACRQCSIPYESSREGPGASGVAKDPEQAKEVQKLV